jgi:hypothetical protein
MLQRAVRYCKSVIVARNIAALEKPDGTTAAILLHVSSSVLNSDYKRTGCTHYIRASGGVHTSLRHKSG